MADWKDYATGRGYVATPLTGLPLLAAVAQARYWTTRLSLELGPRVPLFSSVLQGTRMDTDWSWDEWMDWCLAMLPAFDFIVVPPIPGAAESKGIAREVEYAQSRNMTVLWL